MTRNLTANIWREADGYVSHVRLGARVLFNKEHAKELLAKFESPAVVRGSRAAAKKA